MCTWKPCTPSALKHGSASEPTTISPQPFPALQSQKQGSIICRKRRQYVQTGSLVCILLWHCAKLRPTAQRSTKYKQCSQNFNVPLLYPTKCSIWLHYWKQNVLSSTPTHYKVRRVFAILLLRLPPRSISTTSRYDVSKLFTARQSTISTPR